MGLTPLLIWQGLVLLGERADRLAKYQAAKAHAERVGKPLLVVGGPYGGFGPSLFRIPAHGWGDVCLDKDPSACLGCSGCQAIAADVRAIPFPAKHFGAAFVSHVLEHLPTVADCQRAMAELQRVSEAVFVSGPSRQNVLAWLHPDHWLWVTQLPDGTLAIEQRGERP